MRSPIRLAMVLGLLAIVGGHLLDGGNLFALFHATALLIVVGGTASAVLLQTPAHSLRRGLVLSRDVFDDDAPPDAAPAVEALVEFSRMTRRDGFLALEPYAQAETDTFRRRGLELLIDGVEPDELRSTLEIDLATYEMSERQAGRIWESAGAYAPTMGIVGAVMGLIHTMQNLAQPADLGNGIAVAFVATLYGVGAANLILLPLANRIKMRIVAEVQLRRMLIEGYCAIAAGSHPNVVDRRMRGYLVEA